jgi:bifunctional DNA-binding transcriptional regulator/antitoxin component of YhaV-PrlF toxin-antitoxin module
MAKTKKQRVRTSPAPLVRLGPKNQVTIPKSIAISLQIEIGDILEPSIENGKVVFTPKRLVEKVAVPKLTKMEQQFLVSAKKKIDAINKDMRKSKGLTEAETKVAAKAGLIDPDQRWWWLEAWQKGEREAEDDFVKGRVSPPLQSANELVGYLRSLKA